MTLPQDSRAPMRQQRWVEIENVGGTVIPPFGVCEIVDSYRPESGGYTPGDGRTVFRVRRAVIDNPCGTLVNGPCEIPVGESRRIGTLDDPMLALVADPSYPVNTQVGVKKDSYALTRDYCGYLILSTDYDAPTGTLRVKRYDNCGTNQLMVRAYECIKPGDEDKLAIPQKWNAISKCWEDDTDKTWITICDCNRWLLVLPNECFKVERDSQCGAENDGCWRPAFPYGLTRRVKITSEISCDGCGSVTIMKGNDGCLLTESECQIEACNTSKRKLGCDADEYATFHANPGVCGGEAPICYGWLVPNARALAAEAMAAGPVCGSDANIAGVTYTDVCGWTPRVAPTTAKNPANLYVCAGDKLILRWNDPDCGWDIIQVKHYFIQPLLLDVECEGCDMVGTKTTAGVAVMQCDSCGQVTRDTLIAGARVTFVTGVEEGSGGGTDLSFLSGLGTDDGTPESPKCEITQATQTINAKKSKILKKSYCLFCPQEEDEGSVDGPGAITFGDTGTASPIQFTSVEALTEAALSCDPCPSLSVKTTGLYALCVGSESSPTDAGECTCVDCEQSSASATPSATGA